MPFTVKKNHSKCPSSKPFAVVKTGNGKVMGCHSSAKKAGAQIGAIERSEEKEMEVQQLDFLDEAEEEKELRVVDQFGTVEDTDEFVPFDVETFLELDAVVEAKKAATEFKKDANSFKQMVDNILSRTGDGDGDPIEKIRSLATEFGERAKGIMRRSQRKEKSADTPFHVFYSKERDLYLFFASYSNNYLDQDVPTPEIIASKSHERFETLVDSGQVPFPELWLWHVPSLKIGEVEVITYDKETGVAMAAGFFYKEAEPIAKIIAENEEQWGVSHSMDGNTIKKEVYDDKNVIIEHITFEISPLPKFAAANQWADFNVIKELSMSIPDAKRKALNKLGVKDELLEEVEDSNKSLSEAISAMGIQTKEASEEDAPKAEPTEEPAEETPVEAPEVVSVEEMLEEKPEEVAEPAVEPEVEPAVEPEAEPEVEDAPAEEPAEEAPVEEEAPADAPAEEPAEEVTEPVFTEDQTKQLVDAFKTIKGEIIAEVKELVEPIHQTTEEKALELIEKSPAASLQDILLNQAILKSQTATLGQDNIIDGRTNLGKDKPEETDAPKQNLVFSGNSLVDGVMTDIIDGSPVQ